jgi:hypothetical protein
MATYNTKFSINDTAYYVDTALLLPVPCTIVSIDISDTVLSTPIINYRVSFLIDYAGSTRINETDLDTLAEAKATLTTLLSQKTTDISNLGM